MRFLSRLLDNSIPLPGGYRIGIDPILGLFPAAGDLLSATFSLWLIYDAARLGIPKRTLGRMVLNVVIDSLVGTVPVFGDIFDAAWKSNSLNMKLVERDYSPSTKERSFGRLALGFLMVMAMLYSMVGLAIYFVVHLILSLFK
jgi:hypothetical protein